MVNLDFQLDWLEKHLRNELRTLQGASGWTPLLQCFCLTVSWPWSEISKTASQNRPVLLQAVNTRCFAPALERWLIYSIRQSTHQVTSHPDSSYRSYFPQERNPTHFVQFPICANGRLSPSNPGHIPMLPPNWLCSLAARHFTSLSLGPLAGKMKSSEQI